MPSYTSDLPAVEFDPAYKQFFESFYKISDMPDAHELYSEQFTKDAHLVMASKAVHGRNGESISFLKIRESQNPTSR